MARRITLGSESSTRICSCYVRTTRLASPADIRETDDMIGYVTIGALNVEDAMPFYDAVLGAIGYERQFFDSGWAGYGPKGQEANTFVCFSTSLMTVGLNAIFRQSYS